MNGQCPARGSVSRLAAWVVCLACLGGCDRPPATVGGPAGCASFRVGPAVATCALWNPDGRSVANLASAQILFVVWADEPNASLSAGADARHAMYSAIFRPPGGGKVGWEAETADGTTVALTIHGQRYDLAAGRLFLLTTRTGQPRVRQLGRDLAGVYASTQDFEELARDDPDAAQFVAAAGQPK